METVRKNTIFTNVAVTPHNTPYWEGMDGPPPRSDRLAGKPWTQDSVTKAAHPNSRFTTPGVNVRPCRRMGSPNGVPIPAILFGGRRASLCAAGLSIVQLAAWCVSRRDDGFGNDRSGNWSIGQVDAIRWRCFRSAVTTWVTILDTWLRMGQRISSRRQFSG